MSPNGVNIHKYTRNEKIRAECRDEYGLKDKTAILFVGRICPQKGIDVLLRAYSLLEMQGKKYKLLLVGPLSGEFHNGRPSRWSISMLHQLQKIGGTYLGAVPEEELIRLYNACDILVLPTLEWEMFGMVIPEAMACGEFVIASNCGGIPEVTQGNKASVTFKLETLFNLLKKLRLMPSKLRHIQNTLANMRKNTLGKASLVNS